MGLPCLGILFIDEIDESTGDQRDQDKMESANQNGTHEDSYEGDRKNVCIIDDQ